MRRLRSRTSALALLVVLAAPKGTGLAAGAQGSPAQNAASQAGPQTEADKLLEQASKLPPAERSKAIALVEQAIALNEKSLGPDAPAVGDAVFMLGSLLRNGGEHVRAVPHLQRAATIYEKAKSDADQAAVLNSLGQSYQALGEFDAARPAFERALAIREKALGPIDTAVATSLNNLALLLHVKGDYGPAEPLYRRALTIREQKLGPENPLVAQSLNNLGQLHKDRGDYLLARPLFERALALYEKVRGPEHPEFATGLNNLGLLLYEIGDYQDAEGMLTRAIAIREKALGPDHQLVAQSVNNLALLYQRKAEYAKAEPLFVRSLQMREKALGPDHPDVARALNNLAVSYQEQGRLDQAEPLYQRALSIAEQKLGKASPLTVQAVSNLAVLYLLREDFTRAEPLYRRSVEDAEQQLGSQHPLVASSLAALAVFYQRKGDLASAIATQARATEVSEKNLALLVAAGSEQQKRRYFATLGDETDITLSLHNTFAPKDLDAARLAALTVVRRKGRVLDAMSRGVDALRAGMEPADRALLDTLSEVRGRLAGLVLAGPAAGKRAEYDTQLAALEKQQGELETKISARSAAFRVENRPVTLNLVQQQIPADTALIEIAAFRPFDSKATRVVERFSAPRYAAYVLRQSGPVRWVDLGDAAEIDKLARGFRAALRDPKNDAVKQVSRALDEKVFAPIRPLIGTSTRVVISPDGLLNLVPFAALTDANGQYRLEQYAFTYLTSGRDLLRLGQREGRAGKALVVANPDFGSSPSTADAGTRTVDLTRATFVPLPGTAGEAKELARILPDATVLTGAEATESAVKAQRGPLMLHIATHGFFVGTESSPAASQGTRLLVMDAARNPLTSEGNPLLRSGLAFAGANTRSGGNGEDGILLALEASGLDLHGTRLVVLSACETGVGEVRAGDGVYGLRRALVLAGAESQVMSLWQVSDAATRDLMVAYYKALKSGGGRGDALRAVQLEMLRGTTRSHPFYWASFIQSGDWRPLAN